MVVKQLMICAGALALLSACAPQVPDSAAGVGFGDYDDYEARRIARERALAGAAPVTVVPPAPNVTVAPISGPLGATPVETQPTNAVILEEPGSARDIALTAEAALAAANSGEVPLEASPVNPAPLAVNTAAVAGENGISAENDFTAVSGERTIQDDAARIAQNRAVYQQVAPTALPSRNADGPNIVNYALTTSTPVGQKVYTRVGFNAQARMERNCAKYPSPDVAQRAFLGNGGPQRDRLGLDPDGDGYACSWDPRPFRRAAAGQ